MNLASNGRGVTGSNLGKPTYPGKRELSSKLQLWTSSFPQKDCQQDFSTDDIRFVCSLVNRQVKVHPPQSNFSFEEEFQGKSHFRGRCLEILNNLKNEELKRAKIEYG